MGYLEDYPGGVGPQSLRYPLVGWNKFIVIYGRLGGTALSVRPHIGITRYYQPHTAPCQGLIEVCQSICYVIPLIREAFIGCRAYEAVGYLHGTKSDGFEKLSQHGTSAAWCRGNS